MRGATVGNGVVAVGEGVAVEVGFGVAICACAVAKKAKPSRTHKPIRAMLEPVGMLVAGCRSRMDLFFIAEVSTK